MKKDTLQMLRGSANGKLFVVLSSKGYDGDSFSFDVVRESLQGALNTARAEKAEHDEFRMDNLFVVLETTRENARRIFNNGVKGKERLRLNSVKSVQKLGTIVGVDGIRCDLIGADGFFTTCVDRMDSTKCNACLRRMDKMQFSA